MRHERRSGSNKEKETEVTLDVNTPASYYLGYPETLLAGGASQTLVSVSLYGPISSNLPVLGWEEEAHIRVAVCKICDSTAINNRS
jgi:hypothetical protein